MIVDKEYCMSSFLTHRMIVDRNKGFTKKYPYFQWNKEEANVPIRTATELGTYLKKEIKKVTADGDAVLALSGGIDSAILAKYMPKGSKAYTFKCIAEGKDVIDETIQAAKYAEECGLEHEIIEVYWEDMERYVSRLMEHKGCPIHSIEVQIYKANIRAMKKGYKKIIFGETADIRYGGFSGLLSREWSFKEYVKRYSYAPIHKILRSPVEEYTPFIDSCRKDGTIDVHKHLNGWYILDGMSSYLNACATAGIQCITPYSHTYLDTPLDYKRIRNGENKYLIRELFQQEYPGWEIPVKIPMPRPTNEWLKEWEGPCRNEFIKGCISDLNGDQRWLVYALEKFLNMIE